MDIKFIREYLACYMIMFYASAQDVVAIMPTNVAVPCNWGMIL